LRSTDILRGDRLARIDIADIGFGAREKEEKQRGG